MAKKQTRRSISINRKLYEEAKATAQLIGVPLAQLTEKALRTTIALEVEAFKQFAIKSEEKELAADRAKRAERPGAPS